MFSLFNLLFICIFQKSKLKREKIQKIWKKTKMKSEMIWTKWKKGKLNCEKDMEYTEEK
jgi:hypothetical protein